MANSSDIAQSDLAELLRVLGMGDHARPQSPHEVFQEALGVLEIKLGSREGRIIRLAASVSAMVEMLRSRPDIHAMCGFEERDILAEACAALNAEALYEPPLVTAPRPVASAEEKHWSDCAVHNEPAMPAGPCDCGGLPRFKLVPEEPTDGMQQDGLAALEAAIRTHGKPTLPGFAAAHVYQAMLAAAPEPERSVSSPSPLVGEE